MRLKQEADQRQLEKQQRKARRQERRERRAQRRAASAPAPATIGDVAMAALAARSVAAAVEDADEDTDVPEEEVVDYPPARSRLLTKYALSPGWGGDEVQVDGDGDSMHPPVRLASPSASRGGVPHASPDQHVNFGGTTEELGDAEADTATGRGTATGPGGGAALTLWDLLDENTSLQRRMRRRASMTQRPPGECPSWRLCSLSAPPPPLGSWRLRTPRAGPKDVPSHCLGDRAHRLQTR